MLFLVSLIVATRLFFRSRYLYDIDSINFALGLRRFDPASHQPHPPGYFLYVLAGRLANQLLEDANSAYIAISIVASCGFVLMLYALADKWFNRRAAFFAGLISVFSPLLWFHGTVALVYAVEAFFSALTGYLCWRVAGGSTRLVVPLALTMGLAAGFRPSFLLFMSPVLLYALSRARPKRTVQAAMVLALTLLAWGLPMVWQSGGAGTFLSAFWSLWRTVPGRQTAMLSPVGSAIARSVYIAAIAVLCFGCTSLLVFRRARAATFGHDEKRIFTWIWITPGLLFFALVFLKFVNSGYLLVVSPPFFIWLGWRASNWYNDLKFRRPVKIVLIATCAAVNTMIFLFAPVYSSYASVRHFEAELEQMLRLVPQVASPEDTVILGFDSHFLGYRHAGYYLPGWFTAQYPEVRLASGIRVFAMEHGDTQLCETLPLEQFRYFLFFPLPSDDTEYVEYMNRIRARFPKGALRTVIAGGRQFTLGRVADLPLLFPNAAKSVYSGDRTLRAAVDCR